MRRSLFETLQVPTGYAVELAALVDTVRRAAALDAIAQVDLGRRAHRHQSLRDLGAMATQILAAGPLGRGARGDVVLRSTSRRRQLGPRPRRAVASARRR